MRVDRRAVLQNASFVTLVFLIGERQVLLTPKEARRWLPFNLINFEQTPSRQLSQLGRMTGENHDNSEK